MKRTKFVNYFIAAILAITGGSLIGIAVGEGNLLYAILGIVCWIAWGIQIMCMNKDTTEESVS